MPLNPINNLPQRQIGRVTRRIAGGNIIREAFLGIARHSYLRSLIFERGALRKIPAYLGSR